VWQEQRPRHREANKVQIKVAELYEISPFPQKSKKIRRVDVKGIPSLRAVQVNIALHRIKELVCTRKIKNSEPPHNLTAIVISSLLQ
jgi:hypothetical protein